MCPESLSVLWAFLLSTIYPTPFLELHSSHNDQSELFQLVDVIPEDGADCTFDNANLVCDAGEGAGDGLLAYPLNEALGHLALFVYIRQRLVKRLIAALALVAASININTDALAVHWQILDKLLSPAKSTNVFRLTV